MRQTAIFVDAGYLFAAGSALITGSNKPRHSCQLNVKLALKALNERALALEPDARVLRTYWYDGVRPHSGPSAEQTALGEESFVKLRLGLMNSQGQQKGVDSLIVTDLIDLARNQAIHDALILAGDEDVRVGVQIAQTFGVRVHLLGVAPTRGNVSRSLRQEMDSVSELDKTTIQSILTCVDTAASPQISPQNAGYIQTERLPIASARPDNSTEESSLPHIVDAIFQRFDSDKLAQFKTALESTSSLPRELDAPILAQARHEFGRDLDADEKREARQIARSNLID